MNYRRSYLVSLAMLFAVQVIVAANSFRLQREATETRSLNRTFLQSDTLDISDVDAIMGLSVSGQVVKSSPEYLVRIVLTDKEGHEHLVMEFYEEICSDSIFSISDYCEETALLDGITPRKLMVYLKDATLRLDRMSLSSSNKRNLSSLEIKTMREELKHSQSQSTIDKINAYNRSHNRLWLAGETPLSKLDYETRRRVSGVEYSGWEYYADGIFEVGHTPLQHVRDTPLPYVPDFDWRNRHGINWMTPVQYQSASSFCTAFAAVSCVEAVSNLYYNKKLDLDLSEQELASCSDSFPHNLIQELPVFKVFNYFINHGVCDEESYPFDPFTYVVPCKSDTLSPVENIRISGKSWLLTNEQTAKSELIFNGPLFATLLKTDTTGHAMTLVGYHTIKLGDTICNVTTQYINPHEWCIINDSEDDRIGQTYWVFKDHYPYSGYGQSSYRYLLFHKGINSNLHDLVKIQLPIIAQNLSDSDIVWEDRDGDGYFNWGLSASKPSTVPSWVHWKEDGDDTDPTKGKLDSLGFCEDITIANDTTDIYYSGYMHDGYIDKHMKIRNGAVYSLYGSNMCQRGASITVEANSTLIIEGRCNLRNVIIHLRPQSHLIVRDGGKVYLHKDHSLEIPLGATCDIPNGAIYNRPY